MIEPPSQPFTEQAEGDGAAANEGRPLYREPDAQQEVRGSMATVTPPRVPQQPQPLSDGSEPDPTNWVELIKWCLSKHSRVAWVFAFVIAVLGTFTLVTWMIAPHMGALVGVLGGLGAGTLSGVVVEFVRRHRDGGDGPAT